MIGQFVPIILTTSVTLFLSVSIYFGIRFFAYRRSFRLPHQFDFLWIVTTLLFLFVGCFVHPPLDETVSPQLILWLTFVACLASFYLLIFVLDQFIVEYFLVSILKVYVPPPLRKVILLLIFLVAAIVTIQKVFDVNPWAIYAPTSLLSLGVGFAIKDFFQTFFAGVALTRIMRIGDWIDVNGKEGEVVDINWARTVMRTKEGNHLFIPNSELQKGSFLSYSYKDRKLRCRVDVGATYSTPPQKVKRVMVACAQDVPGVLANPAPEAYQASFGDSSINYSLNFWISDFMRSKEISGEVLTRIWYAFKREGIEIPFPIRTVHMVQAEGGVSSEVSAQLLNKIDLFKVLSEEEKATLLKRLKKETRLRGESVVKQGAEGRSLYLVLTGKLTVKRHKKDGGTVQLGELGPGQFFGELSLLTGEPRAATVQAVTDAEFLKLDKSDFQEILSRNPTLAEKLAEVVAARQSTISGIKESAEGVPTSIEKSALSKKIRHFFNLD